MRSVMIVLGLVITALGVGAAARTSEVGAGRQPTPSVQHPPPFKPGRQLLASWQGREGMLRDGAAESALTQTPAATGRVVTPEILLEEFSAPRALPDPRWLPNGRQILVSIQDQAPGNNTFWIESIDVKTGGRQRITQGTRPTPSPDGAWIAFIRQEKNEEQIWIRSLTGSDERPLTRVAGGLGAAFHLTFAWSPDSRRIAYAFRPVVKKEPVRRTTGTPPSVLVIGAEGDVPPDSELWLVDVPSGTATKVTAGPFRFDSLSWFPDATTVLYGAHGSFEYRRDDVFGEVRRTDLASGKTTTIVKDAGVQVLDPVLSPDGRTVAFLYDKANLVYPYHRSIATVPAAGGPIRQLTIDRMSQSAVWAPDGGRLAYIGRAGVFRQLFEVTTDGVIRQLTRDTRNVASPSLSPDGKTMVWATEDALGRKDVRVADAAGGNQRVLLDVTPEVAGLALGEVTEIRWKAPDGLEIAGLLVKPPRHDPARAYPLLVDLHGGPVGGVSLVGSIVLRSPLEWQMWAAKGFVVIVPDYRSSVTYGWDEVVKARDRQDADDRDYDDIMAGVDHVLATTRIDTARMALLGHSYGAHLTNWIITKTNRFKVAVSYEGYAERFMSWGSGARVGGNSIFEWLYKGKPWEAPENYRNTTADYAARIRTPTLFVSGDEGIPLYHNQFLYSALTKLGVDAGLLVYKGEGHVVQRPENFRDLLTRVIDWIESRIKTKGEG